MRVALSLYSCSSCLTKSTWDLADLSCTTSSLLLAVNKIHTHTQKLVNNKLYTTDHGHSVTRDKCLRMFKIQLLIKDIFKTLPVWDPTLFIIELLLQGADLIRETLLHSLKLAVACH